MAERNVVAQNFLRRYVLRKNFLRKVSSRWKGLMRHHTKNAFTDQAWLLPPSETRVIFDVGANIGATTQTYAKLFPAADIYSVEASPDMFRILESNYASRPTIHPLQYAICDVDGEITFNVNYNSGTSSILTPSTYNRATWAAQGTRSQITVPATTVPALCERLEIDTIDILKLDIEGAELPALRGCVPMFRRNGIKLIYTEACLTPLYDNQPLLHHLTEFLASEGYTLYNLYRIVESNIRQGTITNAIYLSPAVRDGLRARWGTENCGF